MDAAAWIAVRHAADFAAQAVAAELVVEEHAAAARAAGCVAQDAAHVVLGAGHGLYADAARVAAAGSCAA